MCVCVCVCVCVTQRERERIREYVLGEWRISEEKGKKALRRNTYVLFLDHKLFEGKASALFYFTFSPVF